MGRDLADKVVVITGASSGIGRATALEFARQGARLVLAGRQAEPLAAVAAECEALGATAIAVPTDVRNAQQVGELALRAQSVFGGIDVWVNNAGVFMMGKLEETPLEAFRELIDTNLFGTVHGARHALPHVRARKGVIINVASMAGTMGMPYGTAYVSSKWAVRGFSECLRQEVREAGVKVVTIMPASIDTPLFQHGANYTGRGVKAMPPVYTAEKVARAVVANARSPHAEVMVGGAGTASRLMRSLLPTGLFDRMTARRAEREHLMDRPSENTRGNLDQPQPPYAISGGWRPGPPARISAAGKVALGASLLAIPALVGLALSRRASW
jgi:NADP-dependent 3-hydroxy acid dehydrogenase YdfG